MTISLNSIEVTWVVINLFTFIVTVLALWDTWQARVVVTRLNGHAREIVAGGNLRREVVRLLTQILLLGVAIPAALRVNEAVLTSEIAMLMVVPVLLLINSLLDTYDRKRVLRIIGDDIEKDRRASLTRIEAQNVGLAAAMEENTRISTEASQHADKAYHEANQVNEKIAAQGAAILEQGEHLAEDRELAVEIKETGEDTNIKVTQIAEKDGTDGAS